MPAIDLPALALQMRTAQDTAASLAPPTRTHPDLDLAQAYRAAGLIHQHRLSQGWRAAGRKIGFTNAEMWALYGVRQPIWGYMYDRTVRHAGQGPVRCSLRHLVEPRIEPEIVFAFRQAPAPGLDAAQLLACIDWVAHGIEVVQSHFPGWQFQAADTVLDGGLHGELIVGERRAVHALGSHALRQLQGFTVHLTRDGEWVETGRGSNVLDSPLLALAHLLQVLAQQPDVPPIQAGEMVTTGTLTKAYAVQPGQTWATALSGIDLPGLRVTFE